MSTNIIPGNTYNPYSSGWYLLPVQPAKVQVNTAIGLSAPLVSVLNAHTLQGLIELVYVRVGNDYLWGGMNGLDTALQTTTNTLEVLTAVQDLHNALETSSLGNFSAWFRFSQAYSSQGGYQSNYNSVASAFFGVPIIPDFIFSSKGAYVEGVGSFEDYANKLANVRNQLSNQVSALSMLATPDDITNPNSLYRTSKQVLDDLPPEYTGLSGAPMAWSDVKLWNMDYYGVFNAQDLAQADATQVIIKYFGTMTPKVWSGVSLSPGRQIGMGTGYRQQPGGDYQLFGNPDVRSVQLVTAGAVMPGDTNNMVGTIVITFSGRMAIAFEGWDGRVTHGHQVTGIPPTILMINPLNSSGEVQNPIRGDYVGSPGGIQEDNYIGSFGAITRAQAQNAGSFQQNITLAITAAQGLNNTQTEQVRGFLYTFEEFYKSASAVLTSITQLIQKYAQGIRPA